MIRALRDLVRYREIGLVLIERQLRLRTKRSLLGILWPVVSPGLLLLLYVFVFRRVFNVPIDRYPEFLLCGLLPWAFLVQSLPRAIASLSGEPELIRRARMPYAIIPIATVIANAAYLAITLSVFIIYLAIVGQLTLATLPAVVLPFIAVLLLVMSLGMLVALIDVYNQDLQLVLGNLLTVWFFLIPIVYRPRMAPEGLWFLRSIDPMNLIVGQFRDILYFGSISRPGHMVLMLVVCLVLFLGSLAIFGRFSGQLAKDV